MIRPQLILDLNEELIVDLFAGGGGVSIAIEIGLGRHVDIAANHAEDMTALHRANHPQTEHYVKDVWDVDPKTATKGRKVALLHLSPDCRDHSQCAFAQPRNVEIRALAWVGLRWAGQVRPRVITMENVVQIRNWGPLIAKRDKETGRVVKIDGTVAAPGERVPVQQQFLVTDPKRKGKIWRRFKREFERLGYVWNDQDMVAADYGAPTSRKRMFAIARCDGRPVTFPEPTHFKNPKPGQKRMREAWECIDFTLPCPSVLLTKKQAKLLGLKVVRPLKLKSNVRFAKGCERFVMKAAEPFIVCLTHAGGDRVEGVHEPLRTVTGANRGERALGVPFIARYNTGATGSSVTDQAGTITANSFKKRPGGCAPLAVGSAFIASAQHGGAARAVTDQVQTLTASTKDQNQVCAVSIARQFGTAIGHAVTEPTRAALAGGGGGKTQLLAHFLAQNNEGEIGHEATRAWSTIATKGANQSLVACSLVKFNGKGSDQNSVCTDPLDTVTTKERFAVSMADLDVPPLTPAKANRARKLAAWLRKHGVDVPGEFAMCGPFVIWDLGMRMFTARELYLAQGFPPDYIIDYGIDKHGRRVELTNEQKIRGCGNSVSPDPYIALVRHVLPDLCAYWDGERRAA